MDVSGIGGYAKILGILVLFLAGLSGSFILGVVLLGSVFERLKGWDTPWGRRLRTPVRIIAFGLCFALIIGLMIALGFLLKQALDWFYKSGRQLG